jgi:hypothetical protein
MAASVSCNVASLFTMSVKMPSAMRSMHSRAFGGMATVLMFTARGRNPRARS